MSKKLVAISASTVLLLLPAVGLAQNQVTNWLNGIMGRLLDYVVWPIFAGVVIIMFIWAGFLFLTAHGEPSKVGTATKAVVYAVVGVAVGIIGYFAIATLKWLIGSPPA